MDVETRVSESIPLLKEKNDFEKFDTEPWTILGSYFQENYLRKLVIHQLESYDEFIGCQIHKTIDMFNTLKIVSEQDYNPVYKKYRLEIYITFQNLCLYRPEIHENNGATKLMFPNQARLRNFTYASNMVIDLKIEYVIYKGETLSEKTNIVKILPKVHIGKMPIMLKSSICILNQYKHMSPFETKECYMDPGGYFIINGSEKTCLGQEKAADNKIQCFINNKNSKREVVAEIRSVPDWKCISPKQTHMNITSKSSKLDAEITIQLSRLKKPIPLFVLFRALGVISDKQICKYILLDLDNNVELQKLLTESITKASNYLTKESAENFITDVVMYTPINMDKEQGIIKKREFALDVIKNDLFPHCKTIQEKIYLLGYMTYKILLCYNGNAEQDDRDSYLNKRVELTGTLLNNLFRNYFNKLVKDMQKQIIREINNGSWKSTENYEGIVNTTNIYKIIKSSTIENGIKRALATGDFGIKHMNSNKVGVAQVLNRLTYPSAISHLRRINTPTGNSGKLIAPRKLHGSGWGFTCPAETPEGQSVGVVKNLSYMTCVTGYSNSHPVEEYIMKYILPLTENTDDCIDKTKIFLNGRWLGISNNTMELYNNLKEKKQKGIIHVYTSIYFNILKNELHVCNDSGRLVRPLLIVNNNRLNLTPDIVNDLSLSKLSWIDLFTDCKNNKAVLEYVDPSEQNYSRIAMYPKNMIHSIQKYTHCEIHPSTIFGVLASCIPNPEFNQSPRNTYQCAMGKQAMGMYVTNFNQRMDKTSYVMTYSTKPLVDTRVMNLMKLNKLPFGNQVIVAIMTHGGYNQEDSILFNKGSLDRGLFQATIYHTERDEDKKINGTEEVRAKPDPHKTKNMKFGNYNKLNKNGVIPENELIEDKDIYMAKMLIIKENRNDYTKVIKYEDQSRIFRTHEECYVDKNVIDRNGDGYQFWKGRDRCLRTPVIGDKFSSRHGQKGTIGNIIPEENMPFTKNGVKPDIIINPHCIPSRMTIAQLRETVLGKVLLELGCFGDGTSFCSLDLNKIRSELQKLNYESNGNEILYNGMTGEQIETSVFIGPVYYQRLKHMVRDKQHSRAIGPMVNLTRQPAEGRSRDGGLRYGEMERDCMLGHGAARFNKDRLYDVSDKYSVHICNKCGMIAAYNDLEQIHYCKMCENRTGFNYVEIPYSCKLLFQELISMNIVPRIMTE